MASGTTIANMNIALHFDTSGITSASSRLSAIGKSSGSAFGNAWTVAMGTLIAKGISKVGSLVSNNLNKAIKRVDTLNQFPKVLQNFGVASDEAKASIERIKNSVVGLPIGLDQAAAGVQNLFMVTKNLPEAEALFQAVTDSAMIFAQGSSEAMDRFVYAYKQALASGKVDAQNFNQMNEAIPGVMDKVASAMGITFAELKAGLSDGSISIDDFNKTLKKLDTEGGAGMKSMRDAAFDATGGIQTALDNMNTAVVRGIEATLKAIGPENITAGAEALGKALETVGQTIGAVIKFIITNWGTIQPILMTIGAFLGTLYAITTAIRIATAVQAAFNIVLAANPIGLIVIAIAALVAGIVWFITQTKIGQQIFQTFCQVAGAVFGALKDFIVNNIGAIKFVFGLLWSWLKASVTAVGSFIILPFRNAFNNIRNTFNGLRAFFSGLFNFIRSLFKNFGATIGKVVGGAFKGVVNGVLGFIEGFINKPVQAINGLIDIINKVPKVNVPRLTEVHLPRMAQGGVVDSATAALIGEAGQEAVLPLERNTGNWAGLLAKTLVEEMEPTTEGRTINVYMENKIDSKLDAQAIGQEMMQAIRRAA